MFPIISHFSARPAVQITTPANRKSYNNVSFRGKLNMADPHKIWSYFEEISSIYRESRHCEEISKYLAQKFKSFGFDVITKPDGTIIAARGVNKEHTNARILQAHMDIVGLSSDKNARKPIEMHVKDGWLYANDRTLGADNGIGVAEMLAIAEDPRYTKMPLQMIVTTDEEIGLIGAGKLTSKDFYGKYLINLDSELHGVITKGCADGSRYNVSEKFHMPQLENDNFTKVTVNLAGAHGGHSAMIKPGALIPLNELIPEIKGIKDLRLVSLSGGERDNAVPSDLKIEFVVPKDESKQVVDSLNAYLERLKATHIAANPELTCSVASEDAQSGLKYIDPKFQSKLFDALSTLPNGVLKRYEDTGLNRTSQNLGVLKISDGQFNAQILGRSSDAQESQELRAKTSAILSTLFDKPITVGNSRPIWQPKNNSLLTATAVKAYSEVSSGAKPVEEVCHGGLETALFAEKRPDIDMISIGPTLEDPHQIHERLKIDTVEPSYNWLTKILELLPKN